MKYFRKNKINNSDGKAFLNTLKIKTSTAAKDYLLKNKQFHDDEVNKLNTFNSGFIFKNYQTCNYLFELHHNPLKYKFNNLLEAEKFSAVNSLGIPIISKLKTELSHYDSLILDFELDIILSKLYCQNNIEDLFNNLFEIFIKSTVSDNLYMKTKSILVFSKMILLLGNSNESLPLFEYALKSYTFDKLSCPYLLYPLISYLSRFYQKENDFLNLEKSYIINFEKNIPNDFISSDYGFYKSISIKKANEIFNNYFEANIIEKKDISFKEKYFLSENMKFNMFLLSIFYSNKSTKIKLFKSSHENLELANKALNLMEIYHLLNVKSQFSLHKENNVNYNISSFNIDLSLVNNNQSIKSSFNLLNSQEFINETFNSINKDYYSSSERHFTTLYKHNLIESHKEKIYVYLNFDSLYLNTQRNLLSNPNLINKSIELTKIFAPIESIKIKYIMIHRLFLQKNYNKAIEEFNKLYQNKYEELFNSHPILKVYLLSLEIKFLINFIQSNSKSEVNLSKDTYYLLNTKSIRKDNNFFQSSRKSHEINNGEYKSEKVNSDKLIEKYYQFYKSSNLFFNSLVSKDKSSFTKEIGLVNSIKQEIDSLLAQNKFHTVLKSLRENEL